MRVKLVAVCAATSAGLTIWDTLIYPRKSDYSPISIWFIRTSSFIAIGYLLKLQFKEIRMDVRKEIREEIRKVIRKELGEKLQREIRDCVKTLLQSFGERFKQQF